MKKLLLILLSVVVLISCTVIIYTHKSNDDTLYVEPTLYTSTPEPVRIVEKIVLQSVPRF